MICSGSMREPVHKNDCSVEIPLADVRRVTGEFGLMTGIIRLETVRGSMKLRCLGARPFRKAIIRRLPRVESSRDGTRDVKKAHYVARRLQAGTVWVNTYNIYDTAAPFGGYKQSGFGREMSVHALEHYTQVRSVWVDVNMKAAGRSVTDNRHR